MLDRADSAYNYELKPSTEQAQCETFIRPAVDNQWQADGIAVTQHKVGQTALLNVPQLQSRWIGARVGEIRIRNARLATRIDLHLALGVSFE